MVEESPSFFYVNDPHHRAQSATRDGAHSNVYSRRRSSITMNKAPTISKEQISKEHESSDTTCSSTDPEQQSSTSRFKFWSGVKKKLDKAVAKGVPKS